MKLLPLLFALAEIASASPDIVGASPDVSHLVRDTGGKNATLIAPDQQHENILAAMEAHRVVHSDNLYEYLANNHGANHTIYVNDTRSFIHMGLVKPQLDKRQTANQCFGYVKNWALQIQHYWGNWNPVSGCQYTGKDEKGSGSYTLGWSYSVAISENAGVDVKIIKDVLSAAAQVTVTETWTNTGSMTCSFPGGSVGQVWLQNQFVWGWMWSEGCQSCPFGGGCGGSFGYNSRADGGAQAPVAGTVTGVGVNTGCSAGSENVKC